MADQSPEASVSSFDPQKTGTDETIQTQPPQQPPQPPPQQPPQPPPQQPPQQPQQPPQQQEELLKAVHPADTLPELTTAMFNNISAYLKGELLATSEDYKLLESMNLVASEKYSEMTDVAKGLTAFMKDLQIKYRDFQPYLEKIDEIDTNVTELEKTVLLLDDYTKRLESKFKNLDKALLVKADQPPATTDK